MFVVRKQQNDELYSLEIRGYVPKRRTALTISDHWLPSSIDCRFGWFRIWPSTRDLPWDNR